jgi:hypothetical protein
LAPSRSATAAATLADLKEMGFITIQRRFNATNLINLHLVPLLKGREVDYVIEPVSIVEEDR